MASTNARHWFLHPIAEETTAGSPLPYTDLAHQKNRRTVRRLDRVARHPMDGNRAAVDQQMAVFSIIHSNAAPPSPDTGRNRILDSAGLYTEIAELHLATAISHYIGRQRHPADNIGPL